MTDTTRLRRPARARSLRLGDTTVTYVPDGAVQLIPRGWLPETTAETWAAHPEYLDESGNLVGSIGGLLVEHAGRALLIDAGVGAVSMPARAGNPYADLHGGALLDSLAALGRRPADVEAVAFTHLHLDHLGWAAAFTDTDYLVTADEWTQRHLAEQEGTGREVLDALAPRVRTVSDGEEIFPGVLVRLTPGHTVGHAAYVIEGGGRRVIAFGDAMHSPIQIGHPEWSAASDHDRARAADVRSGLVAEMAEPGTVGFGIHFADMPFGRVDLLGERPVWRPVDA
jgi:glyoxylase-like metal-dependent hydrolase (beta-lactamase superfamily II)